jgi:hypothetical protein
MAQVATLLVLVTACGALKTEPYPGEFRQLGQTGRATMDADGWQFGGEVAVAEAAAVKAREEAAEALRAEGTDVKISEKEMALERRHAEGQVHMADHEKAMLDKVVDSMEHEADLESHAVDAMEGELRRLSSAVRHDLGQKVLRTEEDRAELGQWVVDKDYVREEQAERRREKELASEESQETTRLNNARKQVESAVAKDKMYLHHRPAAEHEAQVKLAEEADALRKEAVAKGFVYEDDWLRLLDISKPDLDNITSTLASFAKLPPENMTATWIEEKLDTARSKVAAASGKMLEAIRHKVEIIKNTHNDYDDHQFLALLARTLNETIGEVRSFEQAKDYQMTRLDGWDKANGEKLTLTLAQAIQGVTGSVEFRSHLTQIDTARLANLHMDEACGYLTDVVTAALAPAYQSLAHQKEKLDDMSKIVPSVTAVYPTFIQDTMGARATALLNMAYMQNLALKEAAVSVVQEASPAVMGRLHCTMHSASARSGFGVAVLIAVTAWLAQ